MKTFDSLILIEQSSSVKKQCYLWLHIFNKVISILFIQRIVVSKLRHSQDWIWEKETLEELLNRPKDHNDKVSTEYRY